MAFINLHKADYVLSRQHEFVELAVYVASAFLVPFLLGHPQWLVGIVVNASLVLAGLNMKRYQLLPVIILPSVAVLMRGFIFGPFTVFLLYFIPAIWIGNAVLTLAMKMKMRKAANLAVGITGKVVVLGGTAWLLVSLSIVPQIFLFSMGLMQLMTAVSGGILALGIHQVKKKLHARLSLA